MTRLAFRLQDRIRLLKKLQIPVDLPNFAGFQDSYISIATDQIINGNFESGSIPWVLCAGWTLCAGYAACDGSQTAASTLSQPVTLTAGATYHVAFLVQAITAGSVRPILGGTAGVARSTTGFFVNRIVAGAGANFSLEADASFVGQVTMVMVAKEVEIWAECKQYLFGDWVGGMQVREIETMRVTFRYRTDFESDQFIYHVNENKYYRIKEYRQTQHEWIEAAVEEIEHAA